MPAKSVTEESSYIPLPSELHHYFGVDDSRLRFEWLEQILLENKVFLRSPKDFNDPFDCKPVIEFPKSRVAWDVKGKRWHKRLQGQFGSKTADATWEAYKARRPEELSELIEGASRQAADQAGIFCFAERNDDVLMWSHYANSHRGVCLTFDPMLEPACGLVCAQPVRYRSERPIVPGVRTKREHDDVVQAHLTKATAWAYEREWRVVLAERAHQFCEFSPVHLRAITLGARCSSNTEAFVREALARRELSLQLQRASLSDTHFEIKISAEDQT